MIIALVSQKGGVGKSTTSACLGEAFALEGESVLLIDADPQASLVKWRQRTPEGATVPRVASADVPDLLRLDALPDPMIIVDCPGVIDPRTRAVLTVADLAILALRPSQFDLDTVGDVRSLLGAAEGLRGGLDMFALLCQAEPRSNEEEEARAALEGAGVEVFRAGLRGRVLYRRATREGLGVCGFKPRSAAAREVRDLAAFIKHRTRENHQWASQQGAR